MQKEIFVTLEGGMIQGIDVSADSHDIKVIVIDHDTNINKIPNDELKFLPSGDSARVFKYPTDIIGNGDIEFFEKILSSL